jgi:hypothetical protein
MRATMRFTGSITNCGDGGDNLLIVEFVKGANPDGNGGTVELVLRINDNSSTTFISNFETICAHAANA